MKKVEPLFDNVFIDRVDDDPDRFVLIGYNGAHRSETKIATTDDPRVAERLRLYWERQTVEVES